MPDQNSYSGGFRDWLRSIGQNLAATAIWQWGLPMIAGLVLWILRQGKTVPAHAWLEALGAAVAVYLIYAALSKKYRVVKVQEGPLLLAILAGIAGDFRRWKHQRWPFVFLGLFLLSGTIWVFWATPKPANADYITLNRPYLEPQIVVESVSPTAMSFHYAIHNRGKMPAFGVKLRETGSGGFTMESDQLPASRQLIPGGHMDVRSRLWPVAAPIESDLFRVKLDIGYHARLGDTNFALVEAFDFELLHPSKSGPFSYSASQALPEWGDINGDEMMMV
jgi:hypothetical protein